MKVNPNLTFIWQELMNAEARAASKCTLVFVLVGAALSIASPYGIGLIVEGVSSHSLEALAEGGVVFLALELCAIGTGWFRMRSREILFQHVFSHMPFRLTELFLQRPMRKLVDEDSEIDGGGVESMRDKTWGVIANHVYSIIPNFSLAFFGIVACFWVSPLLGFVVMLYVIIDVRIGRKQNLYIQTKMKPVIDDFRRWHRRTGEWWNATPLIKSNGVERRICQQVHDEIQEPLRADDAVWRQYFPRAITKRRILALCAQLGVYGAAAWFVFFEGTIATEEYVLLFFSFERVVMALQEINDLQREVQFQLTSINKYREVLSEVPEFRYDEGDEFVDTKIGITFDHVSLVLGKNDTRRGVLRDVSLCINPGERVGIVGPSGAGKSQLMNLMLRGTDPCHGQVLVNGRDLRRFSLQTYVRHLGIIPQKSELFEDSVLGNVVFGVSHLEWERLVGAQDARERVAEAIDRAGLDFTTRLTGGLDTRVGYKGMRLSGGQQQRLMIAQAHFKEPFMVIADEATSSLDSVSESKVLDHLYETLPLETTVVMIAHRLSTLTRCEKIIFVRPLERCSEGVAQVTTHTSMTELYASDPIFRELADAQEFRP